MPRNDRQSSHRRSMYILVGSVHFIKCMLLPIAEVFGIFSLKAGALILSLALEIAGGAIFSTAARKRCSWNGSQR